jgi:hypothetical protein
MAKCDCADCKGQAAKRRSSHYDKIINFIAKGERVANSCEKVRDLLFNDDFLEVRADALEKAIREEENARTKYAVNQRIAVEMIQKQKAAEESRQKQETVGKFHQKRKATVERDTVSVSSEEQGRGQDTKEEKDDEQQRLYVATSTFFSGAPYKV